MRHVMALIIKFIMCTVILWFVLGLFYGVFFNDILTISLILTAVSYIIGDLFVLPRFENISATIVDFILALAGVWAIGYFIIEVPINIGTASLISAILITIGEYFFHRYMNHQVLVEEADLDHDRDHRDLQTEFGQDFDDPKQIRRNDDDTLE